VTNEIWINFELVRQFFYCKRIPFFRIVACVKGYSSYKMLKGIEYHSKRFHRESINLVTNIWIECPKLKLRGFVDGLRKVRNEWTILDFKQKLPFQNKIPEHYKAQLTSEAIALECAKNIKVSWIQLQFPGGRRITEELTDSDKMRTLRAIAELRYMLKTEQIPEPTKSSRKCKDCEYRKICLPL